MPAHQLNSALYCLHRTQAIPFFAQAYHQPYPHVLYRQRYYSLTKQELSPFSLPTPSNTLSPLPDLHLLLQELQQFVIQP